MPQSSCTHCARQQPSLAKVYQLDNRENVYAPYTGPCPHCHLERTRDNSQYVGSGGQGSHAATTGRGAAAGNEHTDGITPTGNERRAQARRPPTLNREFKGKVGEIGLGFYEDENGGLSVGTGKIVKISREGVYIEKPLHPSELSKAKPE